MNTSKSTNSGTQQRRILLNGYKIANLQDLRWKAAIYELKPTSATAIPTRASAKQVMWAFKKANRSLCPGMGFIVEVNETTVAIPAEWTIPSGTLGQGFTFHRLEEVEVSGANTRWTVLFSRIVKDALRSHLKKVGPQVLGPLWMDYGTLCQLPTEKTANGFAFCRRFDFDPKPLANGAWALRFVASTACIDADSIAHYYEGGTVAELAEMVHAKIGQRTNRRGRPVAVRVLHGTKQGEDRSARVLDLFSPEQILDEAKLRASEQKECAGLALQCNDFIDGTVAVSKSQCHLILDTQITQDDHDETILEPGQRAEWAGRLRDLCNGCEIFGAKLIVAESPLSSDDFDSSHILPPPVHVRDSFGISIIDAPAAATADALRDRAKLRDSHIRKFGFYEHRPISPLLALPARMSDSEGDIVQALLNQLLEERNIPFRIPEPIFYKDVAGLQRAVEERKCDSLLAVLPEGRRQAYSTHARTRILSAAFPCLRNASTTTTRCRFHCAGCLWKKEGDASRSSRAG